MKQDSHDVAVLHDRFPGIGGGERFDPSEIQRFARRYDRATFAESLLELVNRTHAEAAKKRATVDADDTKAIRIR